MQNARAQVINKRDAMLFAKSRKIASFGFTRETFNLKVGTVYP